MVGQVGQWDNSLKINGLSPVFCPIGLGQCGTIVGQYYCCSFFEWEKMALKRDKMTFKWDNLGVKWDNF